MLSPAVHGAEKRRGDVIKDKIYSSYKDKEVAIIPKHHRPKIHIKVKAYYTGGEMVKWCHLLTQHGT